MKVEVKNVKKFHGHDGNGFDASLYVNGTRIAIVSDDGWGGEYMYDILDQEKFDALQAEVVKLTWCTAIVNGGPKKTYPMDMDIFVGELVEEAFTKKDARGKVITKQDGETYIWNIKFAGRSIEEHEALIEKAGKGKHEVINDKLCIRMV